MLSTQTPPHLNVKKNDVFFRGSVDVNQKWSSAGLFEKLCCLVSNSGDSKDETAPAVSRQSFGSKTETLMDTQVWGYLHYLW